MPPGGAPMPAPSSMATLARLRHERLISDELGRLIDAAAAGPIGRRMTSYEASLVRVTRRDWEKARRVPTELRAAIARETSIAEHAWDGGQRGLRLRRLPPPPRASRRAQAPLRGVLRGFPLRAPLRRAARRLRARDEDRGAAPRARASSATASSRCSPRRSPAADPARRRRSSATFRSPRRTRSRARSPRPCPSSPAPGAWTRPCTRSRSRSHPADIRITTRYDPEYVGIALWAVIHEAGHALYENGVDPELERTPLCSSRLARASTSPRAGSGRTGSAAGGRS